MNRALLILLILVIITLSTSCDMLSPAQPDVDIYSLIIGLDYQNSDVNDLSGTINDAKEIAGTTYSIFSSSDIKYEGFLALQEGTERDYDNPFYPSKENILLLIQEIGSRMDNDDLFIFYYAGHGMGSRYLPTYPSTGYLVTAPENDEEEYSTISIEDLSTSLNEISGVKVIILDSCFSGAHVATYPINETIVSPYYDPTQFYLTAAMEDQESWESDGHGYFTLNFVDYFGWERTSTTEIEMYIDSLDEKKRIQVNGYIPEETITSLPTSISLDDVASSIDTLKVGSVSQEDKITSGPTGVLLFNKNW